MLGASPVGAATISFVVETTTSDSDPNPVNGSYLNAILFSKGSINDFTENLSAKQCRYSAFQISSEGKAN